MLVRPITRTNFLGEVTYKRIAVNEKTGIEIGAIADAYDINYSYTRDKDLFNPENSKVTVYASKKMPRQLDGKGGWKSATHIITDYATIDVPNSASVDEVSQMLRMPTIDRLIALSEKVKKHTGFDMLKCAKK